MNEPAKTHYRSRTVVGFALHHCSGVVSTRMQIIITSTKLPRAYGRREDPWGRARFRYFHVSSRQPNHLVTGPIDDHMANLVVAQLLFLESEDPKKDVVMYINSPGGSVSAGLAIVDTMNHIKPDVAHGLRRTSCIYGINHSFAGSKR